MPSAVTSDPRPVIGCSFATDILQRNKQFILLVHQTITSFTIAWLINWKDHIALQNRIIKLYIVLWPLDGPPVVIHTNSAPGFLKLVQDKTLLPHCISVDIGRVDNVNKNPVAEKAKQKLEDDLLHQDPGQPTVTPAIVAITLAQLNSCIHSQGLSSRVLWTQQDQFTH